MRLAPRHSSRAGTLRLRLAALIALEFAWSAKGVIAVLGLLSLAIFGGSAPIAVEIAMPLLALALVVVLRRVTVPPRDDGPPSEGLEVTRDEAPRLWSLVDSVRPAVGGVPIRRVVVAHNAELSIRLGNSLSGWPRGGDFCIGFPLLAVTAPAELKALLALALGHSRPLDRGLIRGFIRFGEAYDERLALAEVRGRRVLSRPFYRWLTARFAGDLRRLAAEQVMHADAAAAALTGAEVAARALVKWRVVDAFLREQFWVWVWDHAAVHPDPSPHIYAVLSEAVTELGELPACWRWITDGMDEDHGLSPATRRRLEALGERVETIDPRVLFGTQETGLPKSELEQLARRLGRQWATTVGDEWRFRHGERQAAVAELERLDALEPAGGLTEETRMARAALVERLREPSEAHGIYEREAAEHPGNSLAQFNAGRLRLAAGDESGLAFLDAAMALDGPAVVPACTLAEQFLRAVGRPADADAYAARSAEYQVRRAEAEARSWTLERQNHFQPHELVAAEIAAIRDRADQLANLEALFVVRKPLPGFPGEFRHMAMALRRPPRVRIEPGDANGRLADAVENSVPLPEDTAVYATTADGDSIWLQFRNVPGAAVYHRTRLSAVKWPQILFIAFFVALAVDLAIDSAMHTPALNLTSFLLVLAGTAALLYRYERRGAPGY